MGLCQILTPYPKTEMRRELMAQDLVTNPFDYSLYSGLWANVRTLYLTPDLLQYLFWYHRQTVLGWWSPSKRMQDSSWGMTAIWTYIFKPFLKSYLHLVLKKKGRAGTLSKGNRSSSPDESFPGFG